MSMAKVKEEEYIDGLRRDIVEMDHDSFASYCAGQLIIAIGDGRFKAEISSLLRWTIPAWLKNKK
jgi:hypothetical protein